MNIWCQYPKLFVLVIAKLSNRQLSKNDIDKKQINYFRILSAYRRNVKLPKPTDDNVFIPPQLHEESKKMGSPLSISRLFIA